MHIPGTIVFCERWLHLFRIIGLKYGLQNFEEKFYVDKRYFFFNYHSSDPSFPLPLQLTPPSLAGRHVPVRDVVQLQRGRCVHGPGRAAALRRRRLRRGEGVHDARRRGTIPHRAAERE